MLAALQHSWVAALYRNGDTPAGGLRSPRDAVRFEIYRASLLANLAQALADTYPVIARLVGERFFEATAHLYLRRHPSHHGDIHAFGGDFAEFMETFEPARVLPYLADVARLEWLAHQAFHAADSAPLEIGALAHLSGEDLAAVRLSLHPSLYLLLSAYPVQRIWQANQEALPATQVDLDAVGVKLAVFRAELEIVLMPLDPADFCFVSSLQECDLAGACEHSQARHPDFDPGQALHLLFRHGLVVGLSIGGSPCML